MPANSTSSKWALRKGKPIGPSPLPYFHFGTQEKNCSEGVKKVDARPTELWDRGTDCGKVMGCGGRGGGSEAGESRRRQAERLGPAATGRMLPQPGEAEWARQPGDADRAEAGLGHRDAAGGHRGGRLGAAGRGHREGSGGRRRWNSAESAPRPLGGTCGSRRPSRKAG